MMKRCSSSLAETVANTEDLLTEILVRVPAKPLVRFKCVSKHWFSIISDPKFCHRHTLRNPNPPVSAVICDTSHHPFAFVPLDFDHIRSTSSSPCNNHENQNPSGSGSTSCNPLNSVQNPSDYGINIVQIFYVHPLHFDHDLSSDKIPSGSGSPTCNPLNFAQNQYDDYIKIIQSCNGLFLCRLFRSKNVNPPYFILNPTTNQFSTLIPLPAAVSQQVEPYTISIALAFDPSKSPHYKVVCLRTIDGSKIGRTCHIVIYLSETRSWRLLDSYYRTGSTIPYARVLYWNGAIHWLGMYSEVSYFHIDEERDDFIYPPPHFYEKYNIHERMCRYFRESGDGRHLHLIDIYGPCLTQFEVLEMGKDYSGWFVKYRVDLDPICRQNLSERFVVLFPFQDKNEDEESSSLLLHTPGKVISYNPKSKTFKSLELTPQAGVNDSLLRLEESNYRYVETLACV
ncbi:hypothetical protein M0R45_033780 [Rubus argutus]|uniref:F-box domain-containing protein n=1 Tax=Rubus argutus TaxID=59490 RepID=A0AAW1WKY7_RUBAR